MLRDTIYFFTFVRRYEGTFEGMDIILLDISSFVRRSTYTTKIASQRVSEVLRIFALANQKRERGELVTRRGTLPPASAYEARVKLYPT